MTRLPLAFLDRPLAHRGLHDGTAGRAENSAAAFRAAVEKGFGIELDLQLSKDDAAIVFHDYDLMRMTGISGLVRDFRSKDLAGIGLAGGPDGIDRLERVLDIVAGQVPLLIELKDQSGDLGVAGIGPLERATIKALEEYRGDVALMSFNPHSVAALRKLAPDAVLGLTTDAFGDDDPSWNPVPLERRRQLRRIEEFEWAGASFISHDVDDLDNPAVQDLKADGVAILCWTVTSPEMERQARRVADNVTFEGYDPDAVPR